MSNARELSNIPNATLGFKNRIINGDMRIDQRNAGASVTIGSSDTYTLDRWGMQQSQASKYSVQQNAGSVTPPTGYTSYLGVTSLSAYSVAAGDYFDLYQKLEGFNITDLGWGTSSAKAVTLSFWVRSSLTGTFGGVLQNGSSSRTYPYTYTISVANTWEQKSVTIVGDTTGTWVTNNGAGIQVRFGLGVGSTYSGSAGLWSANNYISATGAVSVVGTNAATFYLTGVQLEVGSTATSFDYRPYGTELALCYRYFQRYTDPMTRGVATGSAAGGAARMGMALVQTMRTAPSITTSGTFNFYEGGGTFTSTSVGGGYSTANAVELDINANAAMGQGRAVVGYTGSGNAVINLSAEL